MWGRLLSTGIDSTIQTKESIQMYSPLNEDLMFQDMADRRRELSAARGRAASRAGRRWWRHTAHRAG